MTPPSSAQRSNRRKLFPGLSWRHLTTITAVDAGRDEVLLAQGTVHRGAFSLARSASRRVRQDETPTAVLAELARERRISLERVAVVLPRELLATRYFSLPSQDENELHAMLRYQLGLDLPLDLDQVCWSSHVVERCRDGTSIVLSHLMRRHELSAFLAPLRARGAAIRQIIPEGLVLAQLVDRALDTTSEERAALLRRAGTLHFVVERCGALVYHHATRGPATPDGNSPDLGCASEWIAREIESACSDYATCLHRSVPKPLHVLGSLDGGGSQDFLRAVAETLGEKTQVAILSPPDSSAAEETCSGDASNERGSAPPPSVLALAAVAAAGNAAPPALHDQADHDLRQERLGTFLRTALYAGLGLLVAISLASADLFLWHQRLRALEQQVRAGFPNGIPKQLLVDPGRDDTGPPIDCFEPFKTLVSLQQAAAGAVTLQRFTYGQGRAIALQGSAPDLGTAMAFWTRLSEDPLWSDVRIRGLYRSGSQSNAPFRFEIEGRLAVWRSSKG